MARFFALGRPRHALICHGWATLKKADSHENCCLSLTYLCATIARARVKTVFESNSEGDSRSRLFLFPQSLLSFLFPFLSPPSFVFVFLAASLGCCRSRVMRVPRTRPCMVESYSFLFGVVLSFARRTSPPFFVVVCSRFYFPAVVRPIAHI